jgi:hypothetical protein
MVQIERPVRTAGEEHAGPPLGEANAVHGALVALVGLQVLLAVGDGAAVHRAVFRARNVCSRIVGVKI